MTLSAWSLLGFVLLLASTTKAQWVNVAPNLVRQGSMCGAMQYRDGIVWAGGDNVLWSSTDLGITWHRSASFPGGKIFDIAFYNKTTGLLATDSDVYLTTDGGNTWSVVLMDLDLRKVAFGTSSQTLFAMDFNGSFYRSMDGGKTWPSSAIDPNARSFAIARDGTVYVQASIPQPTGDPLGTVTVSTDFGQTWSGGGGTFQFDCYSLAVDSCDPKILFLVNEQLASVDDPLAKLLVSTDGSRTWNVSDSHLLPYYSGAMATNSDVVIVGTRESNGILRSMDKGVTWNSIGGPILDTDTRNIAVVDDNTIFAADSTGSIWLTTNGGGDSVSYTGPYSGTTTILADSLFASDTVRCDSLISIVYVSDSGCRPPAPSRMQITGANANSYHVLRWNRDSVEIVMTSQNPGSQTATLTATFEDSSKQSIPLGGYSAPPQTLSFDASTLSVKTDTIGGEVAVPIRILGLMHPENVELVLHYELPNIEYDSSVDRFGTNVDIPGDAWPGRSKLLIRNDTPGSVTAYAKFKVFSDTAFDPQVIFDSVDIPTEAVPCEYSPPPAAIATIYPLQGCAISLLSRWIHLGVQPLLRISPNPSDGAISVSSDENIGPATLNVYDMLGTLRAQFSVTVVPDAPIALSLPLESGAYYLRIISGAGEESVPILICK